jgi:hypothetical protein
MPQARTGPPGRHDIDGSIIRESWFIYLDKPHSTQACRSHPRSSRKCTPSTSGTAPQNDGDGVVLFTGPVGPVVYNTQDDVRARQEPGAESRNFTRSPFHKDEHGGRGSEYGEIHSAVCEFCQHYSLRSVSAGPAIMVSNRVCR